MRALIESMNAILAAEGLPATYEPQLSEEQLLVQLALGLGFAAYATVDGLPIFDLVHLLGNQDGGYCTMLFGTPFCRCARISFQAFYDAHAAIGESCPEGDWGVALWLETGLSTAFLATGTYQASPSDTGGDALVSAGIVCQLSPLVLDLDDDGLSLTSVDSGVRYDVSGFGAVQTSWIRGDDALLTIDPNGNGRIDSGSELFGEAPTLGNAIVANGFEALARIDDHSLAGNENGRVDSGDGLFRSLLLWNDRNGDGSSQADELRSIREAGIAELQLESHAVPAAFDSHGNDLGLRGSYLRADGTRGVMIDVFFATKTARTR